jgi:hypothetical protein
MATPQVEYIGFRQGKSTRDYRLRVRHADGQSQEFTLAIGLEAFLSRRVRYQDAAEICFLKLRRVVEAWAATPESVRPAARQEVTEQDLLQYRESHTPGPRGRKPPRPA